MKSLIIYHSVYNNNTEKIAIAIANKINAELVNLKKPKDVNINNYDLIGFGSGVYKESMSLQLFLQKVIQITRTLKKQKNLLNGCWTASVKIKVVNFKRLNKVIIVAK